MNTFLNKAFLSVRTLSSRLCSYQSIKAVNNCRQLYFNSCNSQGRYFFQNVERNKFIELQQRHMSIQTQSTPNPNCLIFTPGVTVLGEGRTKNFSNATESYCSPLAKILFRIDGVKSILFGPDFITVTKVGEDVAWSLLKPVISVAVVDFFATGSAVLNNDEPSDTKINEGDDEILQSIKHLLDTKIKPRAQEDGGNIVFVSFENGIVKLKMQGACTGCPNSAETLKNGIQNMMQFYIPEVLGVERVEDEAEKTPQTEFKKFEEKLNNNYETCH